MMKALRVIPEEIRLMVDHWRPVLAPKDEALAPNGTCTGRAGLEFVLLRENEVPLFDDLSMLSLRARLILVGSALARTETSL